MVVCYIVLDVPRRPDPKLGKNGYEDETPLQTLIREAVEYQELYHKDKDSPPGVKEVFSLIACGKEQTSREMPRTLAPAEVL